MSKLKRKQHKSFLEWISDGFEFRVHVLPSQAQHSIIRGDYSFLDADSFYREKNVLDIRILGQFREEGILGNKIAAKH